MPTRRKIVLGISVGTHTLGMALIKKDVLYHRQMKTFIGAWSNLKLRRIVQALEVCIDENKVCIIAMKVPDSHQNTKALKLLVSAISKSCADRNIIIYRYTITQLKRHCNRDSKHELMEYALEQYPELCGKVNKQKRTKNEYYIKLFEAVVTALLCSQSLDQNP